MPTVEAIRKVTIQASAPGVDQTVGSLNDLTAAQNRVAISANQLQVSMASAQKLIDDNVQKLQSLKSANDNVGSSYTDLIGKARDVSGSFSETVENILNTINHLKLLAVAAYAMSPAFRSIVNNDVGKALGLIPPVALQASKSFLSFAGPALSFFSRIALPIGAAVLLWRGFNSIIGQGSALLQQYGTAERGMFGSDVATNLDKLTKFQNFNSDQVSLSQQQYAAELATRLAVAKQEMSDMAGIQFSLTDPALRFQAIWVSIAEAIGKVAALVNGVSIKMADVGNSSFFKWLNSIHIPGIPGMDILPGTLKLAPSGVAGHTPDTSQDMALARQRLGVGLGLRTNSPLGSSFVTRFSSDVDLLGGTETVPKAAKPNDYDRQVETIKNQIAQLSLEAQGAGKTSQAIEELKTAHDLNDAAMKANIPVTQAMRDQWKAYADTIAALNIQIKQQSALQEQQFKGATMFMSPSDSAAAGVAHGIDPTNWQAHLGDAGPQMAAFNEQLGQSRDLAVSFANALSSGFEQGKRGVDVLTSALNSLESSLIQMMSKNLINGLFGAAQGGSSNTSIGSFFASLFSFGQTQSSNNDPNGYNIGSANGNVFAGGRLVPFAGGGVITSPILFPMANGGTGLAGEAGPEAIVPLKRGSDGRLGVSGGSGSNVSVTVNNNHAGAAVDVQQQKRPGGGVDIVATVKSIVDQHAANGGFDGVNKSRYGIGLRSRPR